VLLAQLQAGQPAGFEDLFRHEEEVQQLERAEEHLRGAGGKAGTVLLVPYRNREHHLHIFLQFFSIFFKEKIIQKLAQQQSKNYHWPYFLHRNCL
jgi:hypothetical protein